MQAHGNLADPDFSRDLLNHTTGYEQRDHLALASLSDS